MQLHFRNQYGPRVWICISFYDPVRCATAGQWGTRGYWAIDSGQSVWVLDTNHPRAYFFAEAADGAFWAGEWGIFAPNAPFDSCLWNQRIGDRHLGMRPVDIPPNGLIMNLIP
ncbi:hypothetical protein ACIBJE_01570 [Micromonospora sp. NPDC050187]|uniref:hypothetical protein n=1 Tax=Micromonospora sp. NPDC050187 TaxID=3364277 RepID=UPI003798FBB9